MPKVPTDARSSVHTDYLPKVNLTSILSESPLLDLPITEKARIVSPFTTQLYKADSLRELLTQVIRDIAQNPIYGEPTILRALEPHVGKHINVSVMGKTQYFGYLEQALSKLDIKYSVVSHEGSRGLDGRSGSGAVAIVGMSGRFPGSESVDELWSGLMAGKDYVTKVSIPCICLAQAPSTNIFHRSPNLDLVWMSTTILHTKRRILPPPAMEPSWTTPACSIINSLICRPVKPHRQIHSCGYC